MSEKLLVEVRFEQDENRTSPGLLSGVLMPYGQRGRVRREVFEQGAFVWPSEGIIINSMHQDTAPILRATPFVEGKELRIRQPFPNTTAGRDAAENLKEGVYAGLSVEFHSRRETRGAGNMRVIQAAELVGGALVTRPEYENAIAEVRNQQEARGWKFWR